ncbi:MAG: hypothetical protein ACXV44_08105, partial [Halobacteriota archaeon]
APDSMNLIGVVAVACFAGVLSQLVAITQHIAAGTGQLSVLTTGQGDVFALEHCDVDGLVHCTPLVAEHGTFVVAVVVANIAEVATGVKTAQYADVEALVHSAAAGARIVLVEVLIVGSVAV